MERISNTKPTGLSRNALRTWGILIMAAGIIGRSLLQNRILGMGQLTAQQLLEAMQDSATMGIATIALILQALETCALPIFAFLLVEGFRHTSNFRNYFLRVAGVAVLSELPYNYAMSGKLLDFGSRNPAFALLLGLVMLYFYRRYEEKSLTNSAIKVVVTVAALLWNGMLGIQHGGCLVLIASVLWVFRRKPMLRNMAGAAAAVVCTMVSPFYMAAPMSFLTIHFHNGEKGEENRLINYLAYPVLLLVIGVAGMFI